MFNIAPQALHIFYDTQGATIAFNSGGSLFFNYHWFEQLHLPNFCNQPRRSNWCGGVLVDRVLP